MARFGELCVIPLDVIPLDVIPLDVIPLDVIPLSIYTLPEGNNLTLSEFVKCFVITNFDAF